jgi:hypothetical protein
MIQLIGTGDPAGPIPLLTFLNMYLAISGDSASLISILLICSLSTTSCTFSVVLPGVAVRATIRKYGCTAWRYEMHCT